MLKSIFYARFHPERGPDVLHQYPAGTISRSSAADNSTGGSGGGGGGGGGGLTSSATSSSNHLSLVPFSSISAYVIPTHELSNRALAICVRGFRVLGFPISIEGEGYERNRFVFNVCFVLDEEEGEEGGVGCWEGVVGKMAGFMRGLEVEGCGLGYEEERGQQQQQQHGGMLRREEREFDERVERGEGEGEQERDDGGLIGWILREVFVQMNAFAECCVRVSATQVLNLRLEKSSSRRRETMTRLRRKIRAWDVPLLVRALPDPESWTWDLVLEKVYPHIDGVNHVKRIGLLADVELGLVKKAVRELVLHDRVMVLDIFHFQAVYALTADFALFVGNTEVVGECRDYVGIDPKDSMFASVLDKQTIEETSGSPPEPATLIELYGILKPGLSVADFCLTHQDQLANIDIRRFITFGVIKGFLKRMHKYAIALDPPDMQQKQVSQTTAADIDKAWRTAALSSGWATPPADGLGNLQEKLEYGEERTRQESAKLVRYLDGKHCLDQICVEMGMQEAKVMEKVKSGRFGEVVVFCR